MSIDDLHAAVAAQIGTNNANWLMGGEQGDGGYLAATLFLGACASGYLEAYPASFDSWRDRVKQCFNHWASIQALPFDPCRTAGQRPQRSDGLLAGCAGKKRIDRKQLVQLVDTFHFKKKAAVYYAAAFLVRFYCKKANIDLACKVIRDLILE